MTFGHLRLGSGSGAVAHGPVGVPAQAPAAGREQAPARILFLLKRIDCIDGVAAYLQTLLTGLRERGDSAVILCGEVTVSDQSESRRAAIAATTREWIVVPGFDPARLGLRDIRHVLSAIRRHDIDVVSPQGFSVLPIAYIAGRITGRPVVLMYHPSLQGDLASSMTGRLPASQRLAYRAMAALCPADYYIAGSRHVALFFHEICGISQRRIHEQVLGVDTAYFRPPLDTERRAARARFALDESVMVAVLPGRMSINKGHDVAAASFRLLRERRPSLVTVCLCPGGGSQRRSIEADVLRDEADRDCFRFLGFVDNETLRDAYWAADIVLLPSRMEGFGLVVAEAMCCGAIVIRTPSGGWQDQVIEGTTGFLVPFNDPEALAAAIERYADRLDRPSMRANVMRFAAERFAKSRMIDGTSALYRDMAANRRFR